jgi:2-hydroxycyclohexanecarboxyl-CoA dehydrogenase
MNVINDVAVITGAASGIGKAVAEILAARGVTVCIVDFNGNGANEVAASLQMRDYKAFAWQTDVTDSASVEKTFEGIAEKAGPVRILIASAGVPGHGLISELTDQLWRRVLSVNLDGVFFCMREALKQMLPAHRGIIVTISSLCGIAGCASSPAYSAAKAGVIGLSKSVARRHTEDGIRINVVAPGVTDTPFIEPDRQMGKLARGIEKIPMDRMGTAVEIAELIAFLCTDSAAFMTGQVISPNGGQMI